MRNKIILKKLSDLSKSKFRSSFHLSKKDKLYVKEKGLDTIKIHAYDFINERLNKEVIEHDGKQTPFKGHPVFIAQHACACCCRGCLYKWHKIEKNRLLKENEVNYIVTLLLSWIIKEMRDSNDDTN